MRRIITTLATILIIGSSFAQEVGKGHFQINAGMDLYNSSNSPIRLGANVRTDLDMNYYVAERFTLGCGFDYSPSLTRSNFSPGFRLYAGKYFFFRGKAYIDTQFNNIDVGPGIGYDFFMSDNWAVEANVDYMARANVAAFRMGIALFL